MKKKRIYQIIISIVIFYAILTLLLYFVETIPKGAESSIRSLGDAAWYLLATLTTVGYGDITPITAAGKLIGAVMMISSAGVLTFVLGLLFTLLFGRFLPSFRLWMLRRKEWYVFSELNEGTQLLAERLSKDAPKEAFIFCGKEESLSQKHFPAMKHFVILEDPLETIIRRQEPSKKCHVFLMGSDCFENFSIGSEILSRVGRKELRLYCEVDHGPDHVPDRMVLFNRPDGIARSYWTEHPVEEGEKIFVLVGAGKTAQKLLERGLLINVLPAGRPLEYHVFGDWEDFKRNHFELSAFTCLDEGRTDEDRVFYEGENWNTSADLLRRADRILFCADDQGENMARMVILRQYFPTKALVEVYADIADDRCRSFGGDERILTRENVMQEMLNHMAVKMNDFYCKKTGGGSSWSELSEFHRQSNIAAADHMLTKIRLLLPEENITEVSKENLARAYAKYRTLTEEQKELCRWLEHKRWVRFHVMNNWSYHATRDNALRLHPLLIPYEKLTKEEQLLDDSAWEILGEIE